jgi:hypothetical protein
MSKVSSGREALADLGAEFQGPILTIQQFEEKHPGTQGRMRGYIFRADVGMPIYAGLCDAVIRVGRTVLLDEARVLQWLQSRSHQPRSQARNPHGRLGKRGA